MPERRPKPAEHIRIKCESCGREYRVPPQNVGKKAKCSCGQVFVISKPHVKKAVLDVPKAQFTVQVPRSTVKLREISPFLLYSFILLIAAFWVCFIISMGTVSHKLTFVAILDIILGAILNCVLLYRLWSIIQVGEEVRAAPWVIILGIILPIISLYFAFEAFWGWAKDFNRKLAEFSFEQPRMPTKLGLAVSIALILLVVGYGVRMLNSSSEFYVERQRKPIRVFHQGQISQREQVYQQAMGSFLPVSKAVLPYRDEFYMTQLPFIILLLCFHLVGGLFFTEAVFSANLFCKNFNASRVAPDVM